MEFDLTELDLGLRNWNRFWRNLIMKKNIFIEEGYFLTGFSTLFQGSKEFFSFECQMSQFSLILQFIIIISACGGLSWCVIFHTDHRYNDKCQNSFVKLSKHYLYCCHRSMLGIPNRGAAPIRNIYTNRLMFSPTHVIMLRYSRRDNRSCFY